MNWNDVKYGRNDNLASAENASKFFFDWAASLATGSGSGYNEVIKAVRANWSGRDADAFIANYEGKIAALKNELIKKYSTQFETIIKNDNANFRAAQAKNADQMKF